MDIDWLAVALRWLHLVAACAALGGTLFMRFALLPTVSSLAPDQRQTLHSGVRSRWSKVVMSAITFLLVSGLWNYFINRQVFQESPEHKLSALYNALFGIKFLLALVVFALSSILTGRGAGTEKLRQNARTWLTVNLVCLLLIVLISNVLRDTHKIPNSYKLDHAPDVSAPRG